MLDVSRLIEKGLGRAGDRPVLLAAPFEIPNTIARDLFRQGRIAGIVVNHPERPSSQGDVPVLGQWLGPHLNRLRLQSGLPDTLLFLGTSGQIGGRTLLEAARRGIRRIIYVAYVGRDFEERSLVEWLMREAWRAVLAKVSRNRRLVRLARPALALGSLSFARGYRDLVERAAFLRLPAEAFETRHALLTIGTLGPGGAERQLVNTARGLAREGSWRVGVSVENITSPFANFHEATLRASGIDVHGVPMGPDAMSTPAIADLMEYFARTYGTIGFHHVVHATLAYALFLRKQRPLLLHTWMDACNVRAGMAAAIVGVPRLILSGRSVAPDHFNLFQPYLREGYLAIIDAAGPVILNNSSAGALDYERWLGIPAGKIKTLPNGFEFPDDLTGRRPRVRAKLGIGPDDIVLGGIMRCSEEKRPDLWLEVAEQFVASADGRRAVLYGDGPMRDELMRKLKGSGLERKILMPGITDEPWTALAGFDILALTSRMEGLPNVVIEAQAAGIPVVCTAVGGVPETVLHGKSGFVAVDDRSTTLAQHCIELARDTCLRRAMGAAAESFARVQFSADGMVAQTLSVYDAQPSQNEAQPTMTSTPELPRFGFGKNWHSFISRRFSDERLRVAKNHILTFAGRESLAGLDFLDIGCGSGIHSMAALQAGAVRIHSFDYDSDSVAATRELWRKAGRPSHWTIEQGDVLDSNYVAKLGKWRFVYSWGVLHHTGAVWQAVRNAQSAVADDGFFYIALYSSDVDTQPSREFWLEVKKEYNRVSPLTRHMMVWWYVWRFMLGEKFSSFPSFFSKMATYKFQRGMSLLTDIRDWIGGWPMEFVPDQGVVDLLEGEYGFELLNVTTGHACSEFLLRRKGVIGKKTVVVDLVRKQRERSGPVEVASLAKAS